MIGPQSFEIPWEPTAKGRPRVTVRNGRAHGYTPSRTRHAEAAVRYLLMQQGALLYPAKCPLQVRMVFRVTRPASAAKSIARPATRPDLDQYIKMLLDGASTVLWADDAQVVEIIASKVYGQPSMRIDVEPLDAPARGAPPARADPADVRESELLRAHGFGA